MDEGYLASDPFCNEKLTFEDVFFFYFLVAPQKVLMDFHFLKASERFVLMDGTQEKASLSFTGDRDI